MNPALEYFLRSNLIKHWFAVPCSLFPNQNESKKIILTINEEFRHSDHYGVRHWDIDECGPEQALPSFRHFRVPKSDIFSHPAVVSLPLMGYNQAPVPDDYNSYRAPMSLELYEFYFDNILGTGRHEARRKAWLWSQFVAIYASDLYHRKSIYSGFTRSDGEIADEQKETIQKCRKRIWQFWLLWCRYLLLPPGELVFAQGVT